MDTESQDMATALNNRIFRDGTNTPTADLPMNGQKHTGVGNGAARNQYAAIGQVQDGGLIDAGDTGGSSTVYTATLTIAITAYAAGQLFRVKFNATCGATPTINFNGVAAKKMYRLVGTTATQITTGELPQNFVGLLRYDTALDAAAGAFWVLNLALPASQAEVTAGTESSRFVTPATLAAKPSAPIQQVYTLSTAVATGTTTIPQDDTIPQITEGDQYMTQAITPKSATNILVIDVVFFSANSAVGGANQIVALFQDATANALKAVSTLNAGSGTLLTIILRHVMVAGTTSPTTFRVRSGGNAAGTTTFNGTAAARLFGGVAGSLIMISEYAP